MNRLAESAYSKLEGSGWDLKTLPRSPSDVAWPAIESHSGITLTEGVALRNYLGNPTKKRIAIDLDGTLALRPRLPISSFRRYFYRLTGKPHLKDRFAGEAFEGRKLYFKTSNGQHFYIWFRRGTKKLLEQFCAEGEVWIEINVPLKCKCFPKRKPKTLSGEVMFALDDHPECWRQPSPFPIIKAEPLTEPQTDVFFAHLLFTPRSAVLLCVLSSNLEPTQYGALPLLEKCRHDSNCGAIKEKGVACESCLRRMSEGSKCI